MEHLDARLPGLVMSSHASRTTTTATTKLTRHCLVGWFQLCRRPTIVLASTSETHSCASRSLTLMLRIVRQSCKTPSHPWMPLLRSDNSSRSHARIWRPMHCRSTRSQARRHSGCNTHTCTIFSRPIGTTFSSQSCTGLQWLRHPSALHPSIAKAVQQSLRPSLRRRFSRTHPPPRTANVHATASPTSSLSQPAKGTS